MAYPLYVLHLFHRRLVRPIFGRDLATVSTVNFFDNYIGMNRHTFLYLSSFNLGGERSRLWMLRQGKRAEEAGMIS